MVLTWLSQRGVSSRPGGCRGSSILDSFLVVIIGAGSPSSEGEENSLWAHRAAPHVSGAEALSTPSSSSGTEPSLLTQRWACRSAGRPDPGSLSSLCSPLTGDMT